MCMRMYICSRRMHSHLTLLKLSIMKARKNLAIGMFLVMGVSFMVLSLNGCTKETTAVPASADSQYKEDILNYTIADTSLTGCLSCVDSLPFESLNELALVSVFILPPFAVKVLPFIITLESPPDTPCCL